jgi:hypothetical protein
MDFQSVKGVVDGDGQNYCSDLASINHAWMRMKGVMFDALKADFDDMSLLLDCQDVHTAQDYLKSIHEKLRK